MIKFRWIIVAILAFGYVYHAQTVPVPSTRQLQNGISVGAGIWAEPNPNAASVQQVYAACITSLGTGNSMCSIQRGNAIGTEAQARAAAFMKDVMANYPNANASLQANGLWFNPN